MRHLLLIGCIFASSVLLAKSRARTSNISDRPGVIYVGGNLLFTSSKADQEAGAQYSERFLHTKIANAGLGYRLFGFLYVGARYEYWYARRKFAVAGVAQDDTLFYHTLGGELGWYTGNPRIHWILSAGAFYPLSFLIDSKSASRLTYKASPVPLTYEGRLTLGVKFNSLLSMRFEAGYRMADFKQLKSGTVDFLPGGEGLNLSGPFFGIGFGLHF